MTENLNGVAPIEEDSEYETVLVTLDNVAEVARRSGKKEQDLRKLLFIRHSTGRELRVKYRIVDVKPMKKRFWRRRG